MKQLSLDDMVRKRYTGARTASVQSLRRKIAALQRKKERVTMERDSIELERQRFMDAMDARLEEVDDWERKIDAELADLHQQLEQYKRR